MLVLCQRDILLYTCIRSVLQFPITLLCTRISFSKWPTVEGRFEGRFCQNDAILQILNTLSLSALKCYNHNNNNNNWFLYSAFLVWDTTQSALQCIITPVTGFNINPALIVHLLNSLGSILARCYFRGAHMPHHATNNVRILPGTHSYTWVESSNVDKVSCWRTKSARHWRESNPEPFDPESRVQSNIPRHLHNHNWIHIAHKLNEW